MDAIRQAVLAVTAASLICSMVNSLFSNKTTRETVRFLCGLFVVLTLLSLGKNLEFSLAEQSFQDFLADARYETDMGVRNGKKELAEVIKSSCETYILDKAAGIGADIIPEVSVSDGDLPLPICVILRGYVQPDQKCRLSEIITADLGIAKEDQYWTG